MRLQKPWVHITVSRSIPIDIPDLASRIPVAYHVASGSFGGNGKKNLTATGFDMLVLAQHAPLEGRGCGLDLLCDMWSSQLSIFGPESYERKSWG